MTKTSKLPKCPGVEMGYINFGTSIGRSIKLFSYKLETCLYCVLFLEDMETPHGNSGKVYTF